MNYHINNKGFLYSVLPLENLSISFKISFVNICQLSCYLKSLGFVVVFYYYYYCLLSDSPEGTAISVSHSLCQEKCSWKLINIRELEKTCISPVISGTSFLLPVKIKVLVFTVQVHLYKRTFCFDYLEPGVTRLPCN